jgi:hypothetical protein
MLNILKENELLLSKGGTIKVSDRQRTWTKNEPTQNITKFPNFRYSNTS